MRSALDASTRGRYNIANGEAVDRENDLEGVTLYDPETNPSGLIDASGASNALMKDWLASYCASDHSNRPVDEYLLYGGVTGTEGLADAVARFVNRKFRPSNTVLPKHILATNGVSSLIDMVAFNICDAGEGVLFPIPAYSMFGHDLHSKAGLTLLPVSTKGIENEFLASSADAFIDAFESAYQNAIDDGIKVKAVIISNPSNPIGRFYSKYTLTMLAQFCGRHKLHLVSDEIYALSEFPVAVGDEFLPSFTSVLSLEDDPVRSINMKNIHAMYGASKDFGMGGLRLGFLITRNEQIWKACRRVAVFTWLSTFPVDFFTRFLDNTVAVDNFLSVYQQRLRTKYLAVSACLQERSIPFDAANGCLFVWLDLSYWLQYFDGRDRVGIMPSRTTATVETEPTRERQLSKFLIRHGIFFSSGELSASPAAGRFRFVYTSEGNRAILLVQRLRAALDELERGVSLTSEEYMYETDDNSVIKTTGVKSPKAGHGALRKVKRALCFS